MSRDALLAALADTYVPSVAVSGEDDAAAFLRRSASDAGVPALLAGALGPEHEPLLAELETRGFASLDGPARVGVLRELGASDGETRRRLREVKAAVMGLYYGLPDDHGRNASWPALGFPGPVTEPPGPEKAPKTIRLEELRGPVARLEADVVVVGSGAGGGVIAGELQSAGLAVVVLERGGYRNEQDFVQLDAVAAREMYLGGGLFWSESGSIGLLAGATLGGGTVINSMVCLRTPDEVRARWARMGLEGLDGPDFDAHLDAVWARIGANTEATRPNRVNVMMTEALEARGLEWELLPRNVSADDDPRYCGYCNAGCQQGCKRSTLATYLQDAADAGARFVVDCAVERVLVEDGRAAGVVARARGAGGEDVELTVAAPVVVLAAGSIETPAVLLRSGIGGPAAGRHLRLHPTYFCGGIYEEEVAPWSGQFQATVSFSFADLAGGTGFLVESVNVSLPFWALGLPFRDGEAHKRWMLELRNLASWHAVTHDHGSGRVVLDAEGRPVVQWELDDPVDRALAASAHVELARLHHARGAREILTFAWDDVCWRRGEDFEAFAARLGSADLSRTAFSAHQMGSCRMGSDPATSVADGRGELHDVPGVWIGDAAALPEAPGVNPMVTIMALARRTAHAIRGGR